MARKNPERRNEPKPARRKFLTGVVAAGAATAVAPARAADELAQADKKASKAAPPSRRQLEAEQGEPHEFADARIKGVPGSDFMVDVIKTLGIKYVPANCASSYRGIH